MNIYNDTVLPVEARREHIGDNWGHVAAFCKVTYEIGAERLVLSKTQVPIHRDPCADAPTGEVHFHVEPDLVDVLCSGEIQAPGGHLTSSVDVRLRWGKEARTIRAFGRRTWQRTGDGALVASAPESFRTLPMVWSHAYGGSHKIPAGFAPGTRLPMPSGEVAWAANRSGVGFYLDATQAEGSPLPQLEDPSNLVCSWEDRPQPVCFAPCPIDSSLRGGHMVMADDLTLRSTYPEDRTKTPRALMSAPPALQARDVAPGTVFVLEGMSPEGAIRFTVPHAGVHWLVTAGNWVCEFAPVPVAVHIRAPERQVSMLLRADLIYPLIREQDREARLRACGLCPESVGTAEFS